MYFHYKIFIHKKCVQNENDKFLKRLSRPSMTDARAHYSAAARRLRSRALREDFKLTVHKKEKLRGFSPHADYTDRAIAAGQRS
jgi:hypothetical protein